MVPQLRRPAHRRVRRAARPDGEAAARQQARGHVPRLQHRRRSSGCSTSSSRSSARKRCRAAAARCSRARPADTGRARAQLSRAGGRRARCAASARSTSSSAACARRRAPRRGSARRSPAAAGSPRPRAPLPTSAATVARVGAEASISQPLERRRGERVEPRGRDVVQGVGQLARPRLARVRLRGQAARARTRRRGRRRPRRAAGARARRPASGVFGPRSSTVEAGARARRAASPGRATPVSRRWIGWTQSWSSASSTTRHMTRPSASVDGAGRGPLVAVGDRGLEPVVAVGEHERRGRRRPGGSRRSVRGVGDRRERVAHAEVVGGDRDGHRPSATGRPGRPGVRPQIGSRLARVARSSASRSLFAFGIVRSWGSTSPSPAADRQRRARR